MRLINTVLIIFVAQSVIMSQTTQLPRDLGIEVGVIPPGPYNAITDVSGISVGHVTISEGDSVRTGVTAILPHSGDLFQQKVPAAVHVGNGFGKLMGSTQIRELGNIETPIILTNTLSVPTAAEAVIDYILSRPGNEGVHSVNPVVGETNDGTLNDIRGRHVTKEHVRQAITLATIGPVDQGCVGAGTGTVCFGFKGGIGTSSRRLPANLGGYTVGVLVQSNFGGMLRINGFPIGKEIGQFPFQNALESGDGSCMIVVATDAPLDTRNLERLAKRAMLGLGNTGGTSSNGSGDYVIAFSTAAQNRVPHNPGGGILQRLSLHNDVTSPLFMAVIEATEEAILNSLFAAETTTANGKTAVRLPVDKVLELMK